MLQEMPVMSSGGGGGSYELTNICTDQTVSSVAAGGTYDTGVPATVNIVCVARNNYQGYKYFYVDADGTVTDFTPHSAQLWDVVVQNGNICVKNGNTQAYGMAWDIYKIG